MKTKSLQSLVITLLICFGFSQSMVAQCTVAIPNNSGVYTTSANWKGTLYNWVCSGDTVFMNGVGSQIFFLESNAVLMGQGGGSRTVYMKTGSVFNVGGGGSQIIYYETGANYFGQGGGNTITLCSAIVFDYTNAPTNGCPITTGIKETQVTDAVIYPNPNNGSFMLELNLLSAENVQVKITNALGQTIIEEQVSGKSNTSLTTGNVAKGMYFVSIQAGTEVIIKKFAVY